MDDGQAMDAFGWKMNHFSRSTDENGLWDLWQCGWVRLTIRQQGNKREAGIYKKEKDETG